jgi:hypothetical protein
LRHSYAALRSLPTLLDESSLYRLNETRKLGIIAIGDSAVVTDGFLMYSMKYNPDTNNEHTNIALRRMRKPADNVLIILARQQKTIPF